MLLFWQMSVRTAASTRGEHMTDRKRTAAAAACSGSGDCHHHQARCCCTAKLYLPRQRVSPLLQGRYQALLSLPKSTLCLPVLLLGALYAVHAPVSFLSAVACSTVHSRAQVLFGGLYTAGQFMSTADQSGQTPSEKMRKGEVHLTGQKRQWL